VAQDDSLRFSSAFSAFSARVIDKDVDLAKSAKDAKKSEFTSGIYSTSSFTVRIIPSLILDSPKFSRKPSFMPLRRK
jgi:hypothetical protein